MTLSEDYGAICTWNCPTAQNDQMFNSFDLLELYEIAWKNGLFKSNDRSFIYESSHPANYLIWKLLWKEAVSTSTIFG
jgi:hypothetical protein